MKWPASRRLEWTGVVAAAAAKLWLIAFWRVEAIGSSHYDDRWFLSKARSILEGRWLGDYDHLTLIKGPGYPLWIALTSSLRIPLLFAQQVLYVLATLALCRALAPAIRSAAWRVALFVIVLFNPMTFSDDLPSRVTREHFYSSLALLIVAGAAGALLRLERPRRETLPWVLLCGFALSVFWHTREESVWIAPFLAFAVIALFLRTGWKRAVLIAAVPALMFAATHAALVVANGLHYDVWQVVEFKEKSFVRAYGTLTGVRQHPVRRRMPMPKETRERVYAVSPAFAELRPFLEGEMGLGWAAVSGEQGRGDIGPAWFMWAFREAVQLAGYYDRGGAAVREYYDRITREIDAARRAGRLDARPVRTTLVPPILEGQPREVLETWLHSLYRIPTFIDFWILPRYSFALPEEMGDYELTHTEPAPPNKIVEWIHVGGWIIHVDGPLDLSVVDANGKPTPNTRLVRRPSPDLYEHLKARWKDFPPAKHARFDVRVPARQAFLVLSLRGKTIERIALGLNSPMSSHRDVRMSVEQFDLATTEPIIERSEKIRMRLLDRIGRTYQLVFPLVFIAAMLLYWPNVLWLTRWRGNTTLSWIIAGLLGAAAARAMILAIIDVTAFFVFTPSYQAPMHGLVLAAAMLCLHDGMLAVRARTMRGEPQAA